MVMWGCFLIVTGMMVHYTCLYGSVERGNGSMLGGVLDVVCCYVYMM